jgi:transcriptional regulator with XRE-family HTH domain
MASFRENLRDELDFQGLTVKELSAKTGIIKGSLDNYLGARASIPPADVAVKIAQALNVSVEYLVTGKDSRLVPRDYQQFQPFRMILEDLAILDEDSLEKLTVMLHALAQLVRSKQPLPSS